MATAAQSISKAEKAKILVKEAGTCDAKERTVIAEKSAVCESDIDKEEIRAAEEEFTQHIRRR